MFEMSFDSNEPLEMQFRNGGGAVNSVNGQTGDVVIGSGDIAYSDSAAYPAGSVGAEVSDLKSAISGGGLTPAIKSALLQLAEKVAYIDDQGQDYYQDLYDALYPPADLVSISAVYTQSGTVYDTDSLDSLKSDLVVTATYDDSSTEVVTTYTLSGTLAEGTSVITVSYGGKTTTFTVTVTTVPVNPFDGVNWNDGLRISSDSEYTEQGNYSTTDYVDVSDIVSVTLELTATSGNVGYTICWYESNVNSSYISNNSGFINYNSGTYLPSVTSNKPSNANYCRICTTKATTTGNVKGFPYALGILDISVEFN